QYGVRAWPTLVLIDPDGYAVAAYSGEGNLERIDRDIRLIIELHPEIARQAPFHVQREEAPIAPLRYPGKVLADTEDGRLFIADSNHNQIIIATPDGAMRTRIGAGTAGASDGDYRTAEF